MCASGLRSERTAEFVPEPEAKASVTLFWHGELPRKVRVCSRRLRFGLEKREYS